jgi:ASC-1-like (ASCH) protein
MEKRILYLTLKKKWFDLIKSGEKRIEYREVKPYWTKRLLDKDGLFKQWDEIHFRNGYGFDKPLLITEFWGIIEHNGFYEILIGDILNEV